MTVSLTVISPAMEVHRTGCADIKRTVRKGYSKATHSVGEMTATPYEGEDFAAAILNMDTDLASWFGEEPYQEDSTSWSYANCHVAPCVKPPKGWRHPLWK